MAWIILTKGTHILVYFWVGRSIVHWYLHMLFRHIIRDFTHPKNDEKPQNWPHNFLAFFSKYIFKLNLVWSSQNLTDLIDTSQERLKALEVNFISHFWYFLEQIDRYIIVEASKTWLLPQILYYYRKCIKPISNS